MDKGRIGYINHVKKRNLTFGISGIIAMLAIYMIGLMVTGTNANAATLIAVLMALPAAQMLTRYFSLSSYKSTDEVLAELIDAAGAEAIYELVIVYGKSTYYVEAASVSSRGLEILSEDTKISNRDLASLLRAKGLTLSVFIHQDSNSFISALVPMKDSRNVLDKLKENAL